MRALFDIHINDNNLNGYTKEEIVDTTKDLIKKYWYDEGIILKENDSDNSITIYSDSE